MCDFKTTRNWELHISHKPSFKTQKVVLISHLNRNFNIKRKIKKIKFVTFIEK